MCIRDSLWGAPSILHLFGASVKIQLLGEEYLLYISYGALFQVLGTGLVPFIRNMGGSVIALVAMVTGFLTNIVLDYWFVWVLPWGMMGEAIAKMCIRDSLYLYHSQLSDTNGIFNGDSQFRKLF